MTGGFAAAWADLAQRELILEQLSRGSGLTVAFLESVPNVARSLAARGLANGSLVMPTYQWQCRSCCEIHDSNVPGVPSRNGASYLYFCRLCGDNC